MSTVLTTLVLIFASQLFVLLLQAMLFRLARKSGAQALTIVAMLLGYLPFFLLLSRLSLGERNASFYLYYFLLYSFSAYIYFHFFNMSETSRRIRLLKAVEDKVATENIFPETELLSARIDRLKALGQLRESEGRLLASGRLLPFVARLTYALSRALHCRWKALG